MQTDPITLEVMRNAFQSVAEEMGAALIRTALSPNIKDRRDCSTGVYAASGELVAQAEHIPLHLGLMPSVVKSTLERFPISSLRPGDAIITNDPYVSGSHLPDICIISPLFIESRCVGILCNLAHHVDIGGIAPGGMPTISTEIFQEGLRIPPIRIKKQGQVDEELVTLITNNVRTSREALGDFQAQLAANNVGEQRLREIMAKYGQEVAEHYMDELISYSERQMLTRIKDLPAGTFTFEDYLEGDGLSEDPLTIRAAVTIDKQKITVDFTGSSPQTRGSVNCTRAVTLACTFYALKSAIDPELPSTGGTFRPVETITPKGTIVNPEFPAPVSNANINTAQRIADVVLGALAQAIGEKVPAASSGSMGLFTIGGMNPHTRQYYSYVETYGGGQGAVVNQDGMDGVHTNMTNTLNTPVEVIEIAYPLRVEKYGLVPNTEGPGRCRGGLGLTRELTVLDHSPTMTLGSDRLKIPPWGLQGGKAGGTVGSFIEKPDGEREMLPSKITRTVEPGTLIVLRTAGGGGYGDPKYRDPDRVAKDVREGFIDVRRAREQYGVVVDEHSGKVDLRATKILRSQIK
ncbi:MAG: hydantoinase B/oxoprolinase family protein [Deltaproteobacteria bacterium]|nr:hydantoinase B/oxoprolinase family protein [Deltaproteobacteria bacterium]